MIQTLKLDFVLPSLNEFIAANNANRYAAAKLKKDTEEQIYWLIKCQGLKTVNTPVRLSFTWLERTRRRDKDNVCFAKKFVLDALQAAKILPNDNNRWVEGFKDDFVYGKRQGVIIEIEEVIAI